MAKELFSAALVLKPNGDPAVGQPVTVYTDDQSGDNVSSALTDRGGSNPVAPVTSAEGVLGPYRGPEGYQYALFIDTGLGGVRQIMLSPTVWRWLVDSVTALLARPAGSGGGGGGNTYTITDVAAQRLDPVSGNAIPVGGRVWWYTATQPPNMANDDIWFQTN